MLCGHEGHPPGMASSPREALEKHWDYRREKHKGETLRTSESTEARSEGSRFLGVTEPAACRDPDLSAFCEMKTAGF